jgi:hypothetical protein
MKKNKIALITIFLILTISVLLYFVPINQLIGKLPFINRFYNNTTLEISTKTGVARVWINGKDHGETPTNIEDLPEGSYLVELQKVVDEEAFYKKHSFQIELTRNTSARIDLEIGPEDLLHGAILYYTPIRTTSDEGFLTIISDVDDSRVFLDGEFLKVSPITNLGLRENQYEIKVLAPGHEEVAVPVLLRNNYVLNLKTFHFPIPVSFESIEEDNPELETESLEEDMEVVEEEEEVLNESNVDEQ